MKENHSLAGQTSCLTGLAAIYARTSVSQSTDDLERQLEACRNEIRAAGLKVGEVYADAAKRDRRELNRLIADIETGRITVLVVATVDRLTGNLRTAARLTLMVKPALVISASARPERVCPWVTGTHWSSREMRDYLRNDSSILGSRTK